MAINYDSLPSTKPVSTVPTGFYKATIAKAEMKVSKSSGNPYLSVQYDIRDDKGNTGKLFDMQFDSEKEFLRYKLQRFLTALGLNLTGSFELKDLCKLVNGKQFIVDVGIEDAKDGNPARNTINSFDHEIYYPMSNWAALTGATTEANCEVVGENTAAPTPAINAADALDNVIDDEEY